MASAKNSCEGYGMKKNKIFRSKHVFHNHTYLYYALSMVIVIKFCIKTESFLGHKLGSIVKTVFGLSEKNTSPVRGFFFKHLWPCMSQITSCQKQNPIVIAVGLKFA